MIQVVKHRRFLWSTLAFSALCLFLGVFNFIFLQEYDDIPSVQNTLWFSNKRPPAPQLRFGGSTDTAWLILVACLGLVTPFLELMTWIPVPDWVYFWHRWTPRPTSVDAATAAAVTIPDEDGAAKPVRPPKTWYQKWVPSWILALSPAAMLFLLLWQGVMWGSLFVPYGYRYLSLAEGTRTPRIYSQFVRGANSSFHVLVVHALGRTSGWPATVAWAMVFIPSDRSSSWLASINMSLEEANLFHRLFGWNAFFWTSFHGIFTHAAFLCVSVEAWRDELMTDNGWYSGRWARYIATPGWFIMCVFAITCLPQVRKHCYNLFRISHLSIWIMMPLMIMHEYYIYLWLSYGFMLYAADLAQRWVINTSLVPATLTKAGDGNWQMMIRMTSRHMRPTPDWAGKHVYLRVSRVSIWETHPYSISAVDGDIITLHSGGNGNWTKKVTALAEAAGPEGLSLTVCVEGPYGNDLAGEASEQDTLVLIAGGLGVTPLSGALQQLLDAFAASRAGRLTKVHFLWVVRQASMATIIPFSILERAAVTAGFNVKIFVTATKSLEKAADGSNDGSTPKEFTKGARPDHIAFSPAVTTSSSAPARSPFMTFLPRFIVRVIIVWCATGFITAGYIIARQSGYTSRAGLSVGTNYTAYGMEVGRIYNASVLANYKMSANYSEKVPWPKGQPTYVSLRNGFTQQVTFGVATTCYSCSATGTNPASFPYGSGPYGCCTPAIPLWNCFWMNTFPFVFTCLLSVLVALACKWFLGKNWPLHSTATSQDDGTCPQSIAALELAPQRAGSSTPSSSSDNGGDKSSAKKMGELGDLGLYEPGGVISSGLPLIPGRPSIADELTAIAATCAGGRMAVYCCGPAGLSEAAERAVYNDAWLHGCKVTFRNFFER